MTNKTTGWKYAQTVNEQVNPNTTKRNSWKSIGNAVGNSTKYATGTFTHSKDKKGKVSHNYPWTVTAHDYKLNIPSNAYIKKITFEVRIKASTKSNVEYPRGVFCIYGGGWSKHIDNTKAKETGWHSGLYVVNPKKKLSTSFITFTYTMDTANVKKGKFTADDLNSTACGIDLVFDDEPDKASSVYLRWVRIKVDYELPQFTLVHNGTATTSAKPRVLKSGNVSRIKYTLKNESNANGGKQCLKLSLPWTGKVVGSVIVSKGSFNADTNIWTLTCGANSSATLYFDFIDFTVETESITLESVDCSGSIKQHPPSRKFYYKNEFGGVDDFGEISTQLLTEHPHKRHDCCFLISSKAISSSNSTIQFKLYSNFTYDNTRYELDKTLSDNGISISETTNNSITFNVPTNSEMNIAFRVCLNPTSKGNATFYPVIVGGSSGASVDFKIDEPYVYHFGNKTVNDETNNISNNLFRAEEIGFFNHRIASELETGAYVLPCTVKDNDALMTQSKSNIHMYKHEEVDYIGCVPIEHHHFDAKSTYKDKLLDSHYKNKRYMGKELASDEDISLNIRLHPHQVTTIQGLIDMDKPIPINANHRCFESDALNHRGWCEIYGISAQKTNPHWYKCEIDVKYLTHNLNTRFKINKGDKSFIKYTMPTLLLESFESGEALSNGDTTQDYFIINTDGGYIYNEEVQSTDYYLDDDGKLVFFVEGDSETLIKEIKDEYGVNNVNITVGEEEDDFNTFLQSIVDEGYTIIDAEVGEPIRIDDTEYTNENQRNIFTLDEGQHFNIRSRNTLTSVAQVTYDWSTSMIDEHKENAVSKIIRLVNASDNVAMFEYEYSDFDFSDYEDNGDVIGNAQIDCHVIGRAYRKGDYDEVINEDIKIPILVQDDDEEVDDNQVFYGSSVSFQLNNNVLAVVDSGYTGKALNRTGIELEGESYYYEVEWKNNNTDGEDADITTFVDLTVQDSLLSSQYASKYQNMIVSPFPVADKKIIFSRNAEEGVIYYLENDNEEFSYLIDPYYQYFNGVDLRHEGSSIFNLNYGYKTVYLENGLVSLGINRLNGQMYLRKWDGNSKQYIQMFNLQLSDYEDVNINSISDDKIELQASNTTISMYRGHPYVIFKHELEDIRVISKFNRVWSEQVKDGVQPYPTYYDLLNSQNLLPQCVGGTKTIDNDCVEVFECGDDVECPDLEQGTLSLVVPSSITEGAETEFNVEGNVQNGDLIYYIIDGDVQEQPVTYPTPFTTTFTQSKEYEVSAVYVGNETRSHLVAPIQVVFAEQEVLTSSGSSGSGSSSGSTSGCQQPTTGTYKLTITSPKTFKYLDGEEITFKLTRGGKPVCKKTIEKVAFNNILTGETSAKGITTSKNNRSTNHPASYKIGARFFEGKKLITSVFKDVKIEKADAEWIVNHYATKTGNTVSFKLRHKSTHNNMANVKVTVYIDGKAYTKKTNSNGNVAWKINKKGNHKYKCTFAGSKNYNKASKTFKEHIRK